MERLNTSGIIGGALCVAAFCSLSTSSWAQTGYQIGENPATADAGPVRLARISFLKGVVSWRPSDSMGWADATMNLPLRQGAQVWVKAGSRAELQFDDGSDVRLGGGAIATLQTMYSDDHGEFTEIKMNDGLATLHLRNKASEFQIDTPLSSVKANGPTEVRVGVGNTVEVACRAGSAEVDGKQGSTVLHSKDRLVVANPTAPYRVSTVPDPDQWDHFNDNRDVIYSHHNQHVPADIDLVSGDLDSYGDWHDDPRYGYVWAPRVHERGWRPYHHGHWVWVSPWGWTWVGDEDWGYAPYHYGTWVDEPYGWAWRPGPAVQYWSPAVVDFVDDDANIGWVALAPSEVVYPSAINIGFRTGNWWFDFSIGQAACYFPSGPTYCAARPWDNRFVNREVNVFNVTNINNNFGGGNFARNSRFIPQNSTRFAGMTMASRNAFVNGGGFRAVAADPRGTAFHNGRSFASMPRSGAQFSGPPNLRPNAAAFTPTRRFARAGGPPQNMLQRSVVRANVPSAIARQGGPVRNVFAPVRRQAPIMRAPNSHAVNSKFQMRNRAPALGGANHAAPRNNGVVRRATPAKSMGVRHMPSSPTRNVGRGPVQRHAPVQQRGRQNPPRMTHSVQTRQSRVTHAAPTRQPRMTHTAPMRQPRITHTAPMHSVPVRQQRVQAQPRVRWQNPERRSPPQRSAPQRSAPRSQPRPSQPPQRRGGGNNGGGRHHGG